MSRDEQGMKLGAFLRARLEPARSSRKIKAALERGQGTVNGAVERFASAPLRPGDRVAFRDIAEEAEAPPLREAQVLYEDGACLVLDKAPGQSCGPEDRDGLPGQLAAFARGRGLEGLWLCHRLDRDTSGALLLAKSAEAREALFTEFKERRVLKAYEACVRGATKAARFTLRSRLGRAGQRAGRDLWASRPDGAPALTEVAVLTRGKGWSRLRLFPKTGRTHQLRVQLSEDGHAIIGDRLYGPSDALDLSAPRQLLHARGLIFQSPAGRQVSVEAPVAADFEAWARSRLARERKK